MSASQPGAQALPSLDAAAGSSFYALALQLLCRSVNAMARAEARAAMMATIGRLDQMLSGAIRFHGPDTRLVVLPEYFLTGHPFGESVAEWADKAALDLSGPEYDALGRLAEKHKIFLAGNAYERDPKFPGLHFQASFVLSPRGEVILRYRRLISMFAPSPYDVWDRYLDAYGAEAIFPVATSEIGRLAAIASEEILYPEIARCLALKGAEIFLHSSSEVGLETLSTKNIAKRARAIENLAYVVSANSAGIEGALVAAQSTDAHSQIVDYKGNLLIEAGYGETINAFAEIDLGALRRYRRRPGMGNLLARQPLQLYAGIYAETRVQERGSLLEGDNVKVPSRSFFLDRQRAVIDGLVKAGII